MYASVFARFLHLAELLSICVRQERFEGLEACVDALHAPALVAVGNLSPDSSLLVLGRLWTEGDVGQAEEGQRTVIILSIKALRPMRQYKLISDAHLILFLFRFSVNRDP